MSDKYFRGFHAIGEVAERMKKLAEHCQKFHACSSLRLYRKDYDLLVRWPKAAELHGITQSGGVPYFMGFKLDYDRTEKRYPTKAAETTA